MDVTLPNGVVITDVPDDMGQRELAKLTIADGIATEEDFADYDLEGNTLEALSGGVSRTGGALRNWWNTVTNDPEDILEQAAKPQEQTPAQGAFMGNLQDRMEEGDEGVMDALKNVAGAVWEEPRGAYHELVSQLPNTGVVLGGGAAGGALGFGLGGPVGAAVGAALGMFAGNTSIETGFIVEELAADGLISNSEIEEATRQGMIKGGVITAVDLATFGLSKGMMGMSGKAVEKGINRFLISKGVDVADDAAVRAVLSNRGVWEGAVAAGATALEKTMSTIPRAGRGLGAMALESLGEATGEYGGSLAAGLEASPTEAILEGVMAAPMSIAEMRIGKALSAPGTNTEILMGKKSRAISEEYRQRREADEDIAYRMAQVEEADRLRSTGVTSIDDMDTGALSYPEVAKDEVPLETAQNRAHSLFTQTGGLGSGLTFSVDNDVIKDSSGRRWGPALSNPAEAAMLAGALNEQSQRAALIEDVSNLIDESGETYSASQVEGLRLIGRRTLSNEDITYPIDEVRVAESDILYEGAEETGEGPDSGDTYAMTAQEALEAGLKASDMTAVQKFNARRLRRGLEEKTRFTVAETKRILGDKFGRVADVTYGPPETYTATSRGGKPVITTELGDEIDSRPATAVEVEQGLASPGGELMFADLRDAMERAAYLNSKKGGSFILGMDFFGEKDLALEDFEKLLQRKNINNGLDSPAIRAIAEKVTGVKAKGKTKPSDMSASDKRVLFQHLRSLPRFDTQTTLPTFAKPRKGQFKKAKPAPLALPAPKPLNEAVTKAVKSAMKGFGLERIGTNIVDRLRHFEVGPNKRVFTGEELTSEGLEVAPEIGLESEALLNPALDEIFLGLDNILSGIADKGPVTPEQLQEAVLLALNHEVLHALRGADLFTQNEWNILEQAAMDNQKPGTDATYEQWANAVYPELSQTARMEESIAELTKDALGGSLQLGGKPRSLMRRIVEFFRRLVGAADKMGVTTPSEVLAAIRGGEIGGREEGVVRTLRQTEKNTGVVNKLSKRTASYYVNDWSKALGVPPKLVDALTETGDEQRGAPEEAMVRVKDLSSGVIGVVEPVGDIQNRMSPNHGLAWSREETLTKIDMSLRALDSSYGFEREFRQNLVNNAAFRGQTVEEHTALVDKALQEYSDAHARLPVYNKPMRLARDAAVAVGDQKWDKASFMLHALREMIDTPAKFDAEMGKVWVDSNGNPAANKFSRRAQWQRGIIRAARADDENFTASVPAAEKYVTARIMKNITLTSRKLNKIALDHPDVGPILMDLPELLDKAKVMHRHPDGGVTVILPTKTENGSFVAVGIKDGAITTITPQDPMPGKYATSLDRVKHNVQKYGALDFNTRLPGNSDAQFSRRPSDRDAVSPATNALGLYSQVEKAVLDMNIPQWKQADGVASGAEIWQKLSKSPGVKAEELLWMGMEEYLKSGGGRTSSREPIQTKFTRREVAAFARNDGVEVNEVVAEQDDYEDYDTDDIEWDAGEIQDDPENWEHIQEDIMSDFDSGDAETMGIEINSWMHDWLRQPQNTEIMFDHYDLRPSEADPRQILLPMGITNPTKQDVIQHIFDNEEPEVELRDEARGDFIDAADKAAREMYMDDPYKVWSAKTEHDGDLGLYIVGNDNGYSIRAGGTAYNDQIRDHGEIYSFGEAQIQAEDYARENELVEYRNKGGTQWGEYIEDGGENYREIKLTLPETGDDFVYSAHFEEPNIVAFLRVTDRDMVGDAHATVPMLYKSPFSDTWSVRDRSSRQPVSAFFATEGQAQDALENGRFAKTVDPGMDAYFIDEFQSDWHQQGRQKGYRSREGVNPAVLMQSAEHKIGELNTLLREVFYDIDSSEVKLVPPNPDEPLVEVDGEMRRPDRSGTVSVHGFIERAYEVLRNRKKIDEIVNSIGEPPALYGANNQAFFDKNVYKYIIDALERSPKIDMETAAQDVKAIDAEQKQADVERHGVPDAPFKGDNWLALGLKRAIVDAISEGKSAIAWADGAMLANRWSSRYEKMYQTQYDRKMPSIVKKILKVAPQHKDMDSHEEANGEDSGYWIAEITPELKEQIAAEGLPLFSKRWSNPNREYDADTKAAIEKAGFGTPPISRTFKERWKKARYRFLTKFRQGMVDQFASFRDVLEDPKTWMLAHLSGASSGGLEAALEFGQLYLTDEGVLMPDMNKKPLKAILEPLGVELDDFMAWVAAHRADKLSAKDKEHLLEGLDIEALKKLGDGVTDTGADRLQLYKSVEKELRQWQYSINKIAADTGLLNAEEADLWLEEGFYVPFYRVLNEDPLARGPRTGAGLVRQQAYREIKGSEKPLDDLLNNLLMNSSHLLGASLKNQAGNKALKEAMTLGIARQVPAAIKGKDAVYVRENGQQVWYELDGNDGALIMESLLALNWQGLKGPAMDASRMFKRALTTGVTASPEFKLRNIIRDTISAIAVAPMSVNFVRNLATGWKATKKHGDIKGEMLASGAIFGDSGYIHGADPEALRYMLEKVHRNTILDSRDKFKTVWHMYQDWGARLENVNRAANYMQDIAANKGHLTAAFNARDHLDFARTGSFPAVRAIAQSVPFLNARLQGLDKISRAIMDPSQRGQFTAVLATYTAAAVLLYLSMRDDEDYRELEQWKRDTYHAFKVPGSETMFFIPRPFEVGAMANTAERFVEQLVDNDVHGELFVERLGHALFETFNFNPTPQIVKPPLEVAMNKNWFTGQPIESMGMQKLSAPNRKKAWTSETAIAASGLMDKILWDEVVLSPVQIQHLVRGYLGWLGSTILATTDLLIARPLTDAPVAPTKRWTEYPVAKAFSQSGPARNTQFTSSLYEQMSELDETVADIREYRKIGEFEDAMELAMEKRDMLRYKSLYRKQRKRLTEMNNRIAMITRHKTLSGDEKRRMIDQITLAKNRLTESLTKMSQQAFR